MINLSTKNSELLYEVAESHMNWYHIWYSDTAPKFEILLELNHTKLSYLIDEHTTEQDITDALITMKANYNTMIEDYGPHNNNYE